MDRLVLPDALMGPAVFGRFVKGPRKMTRVSAFSSPLLLGFDEVERALERLSKATGDGYPPYNIERLGQTNGSGDVLRITLALAGFADDELDVLVEENELVIRGRQKDEPARTYLYRGIAARQFQKTFVLAEGIEVLGAALKDGLLSIDLTRPLAERVARRIEISSGDGR
jgi:HSP20 family molecular chaperone IbpA